MKNDIKQKLKKTIIIVAHPAIWCACIANFWVGSEYLDAMGYSLIVIWFLIPLVTFVSALCIALNNYLGKLVVLLPVYHGAAYMLTSYLTFSLANTLYSGNINMPDNKLLVAGCVLSLIGCGIGYVFRKI